MVNVCGYWYFQSLMIEFFNAKMQEAKLNTAPGNPVIAAQINLEQNFAFIEVNITNQMFVCTLPS